MFLHLQIDGGVITGVLRSSFPDPPDGGAKGLPDGRSFVTIGDEDHPSYDRLDSDWLGHPVKPTPTKKAKPRRR